MNVNQIAEHSVFWFPSLGLYCNQSAYVAKDARRGRSVSRALDFEFEVANHMPSVATGSQIAQLLKNHDRAILYTKCCNRY